VSYKYCKLGEVCLVQRGTTITQKQAIDGDIPVVAGGLKPTYFHNKANRFNSTITISGSGANAGFVNMWKQPIFASDCSTVEVKDTDIDIVYVYYFLLSKQGYIYENLRSGAAQPHVYGKDIAQLDINIPPLTVQKKIVAKLDVIFADIDKAIAAAEVNAKNAEALFQSYLIQVFDYFDKNFISDTIGKVCTLRSGNTVSSSLEKTEGEIPYLKVADMNLISNQESITTSSRFLNKSDINKKSVIPKGSTIFPKRGGAIDTNKKRITDVDIAVDLNIMSVYPGEKLNPYLLYFYFLSLDMKKLGSGSSIRQINNYDIEPLVINFPESIDKQLELVNRISNLKIQSDKLSLNYKNKKSELLSLKQSILKKAFIVELVKE
jgi:type I restriction enzyme S subunit